MSHDTGRYAVVKIPSYQNMLDAFLTLKGFTPVAPKQLFSGSNLAQSKSNTPRATEFVITVMIQTDATPRSVSRFDAAAIHHPIAGLALFLMRKKNSRHLIKRSSKLYL
jgi:hypothetical protein